MKILKPFLLILAAAGLLWACETTQPFIDDVKLALITGDFDMALSSIDDALAADSSNYVAHYYKGVVLASQAETFENPTERKPYYERAKESFETSRMWMERQEERPDEYEDLNNSIIGFWAEEYNIGVEIQNDDSLFAATDDPFRKSLAHFQNAAVVNPDSAMTYMVMSSTHFQLDEVEEAIETYKMAMDRMEQPEVDDYEYLISLLLFENRYDEAISYSEEGREYYPDEPVFVQFLADAYIQMGERERAIEMVEDLIAQDPDNPQYRRVLGTQIYQTVENLTNQLSEDYETIFDLRNQARQATGDEQQELENQVEQLAAEIESKEAQVDEFVQISIEQMERVVELEPESESANFILGIIYQNLAANLFERRNSTIDDAEAQELDTAARENLQEARVYYEKAAEINPDEPENWQSLFQVYTTLGMEEEAEEAMRKAGLDD